MKRVSIIIFVSTIFFASCQSQDNKYFEGIIKYTVDFKSEIDPNDKPFGDTLVVRFKDGLIKRDYNTGQPGGLSFEIIDPVNGLIYMQLVGNDTVYWYDIKVNSSYSTLKNTTISKSDETILGNECNILTTEILYTNKDLTFKTNDTYFYSSVLKVDPLWFKNYKYGFSDKVFSLMKALCLKYKSITQVTSMTMTAFEIKEVSLDRDTFKIDKKKPLREYVME